MSRSNLVLIRQNRGLSQAALAERSGLSENTIRLAERSGSCHRKTKRQILEALRLEWQDVRAVWPDERAPALPAPVPTEIKRPASAPVKALERHVAEALSGTEPGGTNGFSRHFGRLHELIDAQSAKGLAKYPEDPARQQLGPVYWLREAQQELVDAAVYLERAIEKLEEATE